MAERRRQKTRGSSSPPPSALWLFALLAVATGCRGQPQGRAPVRSGPLALAPEPPPARGQSAERETATLPMYCLLHVDAKNGVAFVAGAPEQWNTWEVNMWRRGNDPERILSGTGTLGGLSASRDGSSVLVWDLMPISDPERGRARVTWVRPATREAEPREFRGELFSRHGAWDLAGERWIGHKQRGDAYVLHSGSGETVLRCPRSQDQVGMLTYWLPDSSASACVLTADGVLHRISADGESVITRLALPKVARLAVRGNALFVVSQAEVTRVDIGSKTIATKQLGEEAQRWGEIWKAVVLDGETLAVVAGPEESEEATVFLLRCRDASIEVLDNVPCEPQLVEIGGDERGLCVAWPDLACTHTTVAWYDLPK